MSDPATYVAELVQVFESHRQAEKAQQMSAYMKYKFPFLGIPNPERKKLSAFFIKEVKSFFLQPPFPLFHTLWNLAEREYQYVAMDLMDKYLKKLKAEDIPQVQELITTKSWWDSVDLLASHALGAILKGDSTLQEEWVSIWMSSGNMWLERSSMLFQLSYKEDTNWPLLQETCLKLKESDEFFIQKAIGWSLRQYSKTEPERVNEFLEAHEWKPLSKREGKKWLIKSGFD